VESRVFEEGDLDAEGNDLPEIGGGGDVLAAGAEVGEPQVAGAGKFKTRGKNRGVEVNDGAELDLESELHGVGGDGLAVQDPSATVGKGRGESWEQPLTLLVAEALDIERLHGLVGLRDEGVFSVRVFIGEWGAKREAGRGVL
jgi:hypothetical protein